MPLLPPLNPRQTFHNLACILLPSAPLLLPSSSSFLSPSLYLLAAVLHPFLSGGLTPQVFVTALLFCQTLTASLASYYPSHFSLLRSLLLLTTLFTTWIAVFIFPPLRLPSPTGPHAVGAIDVFLAKSSPQTKTYSTVSPQTHLSARILYPSSPPSVPPPRFPNQPLGTKICKEFMEFGAPGPLKNAGWLLHHWLTIDLPFERNAKVLDTGKRLPVVVFR